LNTLEFKGFAGIRLSAEEAGGAGDPLVLLVHGGGQSRAVWSEVAAALVQAGRRVINLDLRGHGASEWPADGRYEFDAFVQDLKAVLAALETRPVVVAASLGGWVAAAALADDAATLAAGLVLVDVPTLVDSDLSRLISEKRKRFEERSIKSGAKPQWDPRLIGGLNVIEVQRRVTHSARNISVPVLFVRGASSDFGTAAEAGEFVRFMPNAELAEVENARLLVTAARTETFNGLLLDFLERKLPRNPPEYRAGSDVRTLRTALGCFATGVTVVTAMTPAGRPIGLTANSFTSVSLDPPLLLVCIANNAGSAETLKTAAHFAVNVLQIGQQPASNRFAGKGEDRFAATTWECGETGVPVLIGSLSAFECEHQAVHPAGDHFILVGRVIKATFDSCRDPLLFFRGKYRRLHFA